MVFPYQSIGQTFVRIWVKFMQNFGQIPSLKTNLDDFVFSENFEETLVLN